MHCPMPPLACDLASWRTLMLLLLRKLPSSTDLQTAQNNSWGCYWLKVVDAWMRDSVVSVILSSSSPAAVSSACMVRDRCAWGLGRLRLGSTLDCCAGRESSHVFDDFDWRVRQAMQRCSVPSD